MAGAGAGHVDGREAGLLDQPGADGVVGARRDQHARAGQQLPEGFCGAHVVRAAGWLRNESSSIDPNGSEPRLLCPPSIAITVPLM